MDESSEVDTLDRLVRTHLPAMMRFATRLTGRPETAEDIVQDALVRVASGWKSFRGDADFRTWVFRIVVNVFRDGLRRRVNTQLDAEPADSRAEPAEHAMHQELRQLIAERVSALPPRQREVLVLMALEGFTSAETARLLRISEPNVHSNLHLARKRLREGLAAYLTEPQ